MSFGHSMFTSLDAIGSAVGKRPIQHAIATSQWSTEWAYSTGKVPSKNVGLQLLTEAGQSNGKFCPRSNWKHGDLD